MVPAEILIFYFMMRGLETYDRAELSYAPLMVFVSTFFVNLFSVLIGPSITWYSMMMLTLNAVLSFVLTLVFIQAIPVLTLRKTHALRNEEILCIIILLASVMTGAVGWTIQSLSVEHVLSRYLILLFALVGELR